MSTRKKRTREALPTQSERLEALRSSVDERINILCSDRNEWVKIGRNTLLETEKRNIHRRATHWTELVNNKVKDTNSRLSLDSTMFANVTHKFLYNIDTESMNKHLGFIISWKGLKTRQIQNAPKTYLEFENKAKNWLNGRRAPNYAATLFPDMIRGAEIYADYISRQIFANNPKYSKLYCRICIIGFLSALCSARISLNDASKKAYLICENSVKTGKTAVSQILQRYASDHPYQDKFPSHLREASDYFENKYMELISDFAIELNQKQRAQKLNCAKNIGGQVLDIINNSTAAAAAATDTESNASLPSGSGSVHSHSSSPHHQTESTLPASVTHSIMKDITNCDGNLNSISMSIDQFNKLTQFLSEMITNQKTQQSTINDLVQRVHQLEGQQQRILRDVTSNSSRSMSPPADVAVAVVVSPQHKHHPQQQQHHNGCNNNNNNNNNHTNACYNGNGHNNTRFIPKQQRMAHLQNARVSPSGSHTTKTTDNTQSVPSSHPYAMNTNVQNTMMHNIQVHNIQTRTQTQAQAQQQRHMIGVQQMNRISNITRLPVPQITNINVNGMNVQNMNHVIATPATNMVAQIPHNGNINNNATLPTTSLYGVGSYDSNDGDANMFGFGYNQSFNSSDAGMANMMASNPNAIPLDSGMGFHHFSDQSMNFQPAANYT